MKKFFFDCGTRDATASFGIFALRLMVGLMMLIGHGIPKLLHFSTYQKEFYVPDIFPLSLMSHAVSLSACIAGEVVAAPSSKGWMTPGKSRSSNSRSK